MAALCAPLLACGPGAALADADTVTFGGGVLLFSAAAGQQTISLGPGTTLGNEYRFTSTSAITIGASAQARCDLIGAAVECDDAGTVTVVTINAGDGGDTVSATAALTTATISLNGQGGADTLRGSDGPEVINGGGGSDILSYTDGRDESITLDLATSARPDGDTVSNVEVFQGGPHNDTMSGGDLNDALVGGAGNDVIAGRAGMDFLDGETGRDTVRYNDGRGSGVTVDLAGTTFPDGDTVHSFANVVGTPLADHLTGDTAPNSLTALAGNDTIEARDDVRDTIDCGDGADTVFANGVDALTSCEAKTVVAPFPPPPPPPAPVLPAAAPPAVQLPPITVGISAAFRITPRGTKISQLTVRNVPAGVKLRLRCQTPKRRVVGSRCPFRRATLSIGNERARVRLAKRFKSRRLAPRTVIRIYVTAPGRVGAAARFRLRAGKSPVRARTCVNSSLTRVAC